MGQKREIIKAGVGLIVGIGVGAIAGNAVKMVRPTDVGKIKNLCIGAGALVLTWMASDQATKYTDEQIDSIADTVNGLLKTEEDEPEMESEVEEETSE